MGGQCGASSLPSARLGGAQLSDCHGDVWLGQQHSQAHTPSLRFAADWIGRRGWQQPRGVAACVQKHSRAGLRCQVLQRAIHMSVSTTAIAGERRRAAAACRAKGGWPQAAGHAVQAAPPETGAALRGRHPCWCCPCPCCCYLGRLLHPAHCNFFDKEHCDVITRLQPSAASRHAHRQRRKRRPPPLEQQAAGAVCALCDRPPQLAVAAAAGDAGCVLELDRWAAGGEGPWERSAREKRRSPGRGLRMQVAQLALAKVEVDGGRLEACWPPLGWDSESERPAVGI